MDLGLHGQVYVVTGGSGGLGRATADGAGRRRRAGRALRAAPGERRRRRSPSSARRTRPAWWPTTPTPATPPRAGGGRPRRRTGGSTGRWSPSAARGRDGHGHPRRGLGRGHRVGVPRRAAARPARSAGSSGTGGSIAFVLSSSVKRRIAGLAISNGLRPGLAMVAKTLADELGPARGPGERAAAGPGRDRPGALARRADRGRRGGQGAGVARGSRCAATAGPRSSAGPRRSCSRRPRASSPA